MQKINQKNTWELNLIDHLSEIIKVESDDDAETNFQKVLVIKVLYLCQFLFQFIIFFLIFFMFLHLMKASCTLEAGVKIYSLRVDSVHSEAYKVLGGINRAGRDDDKGHTFPFDLCRATMPCIAYVMCMDNHSIYIGDNG